MTAPHTGAAPEPTRGGAEAWSGKPHPTDGRPFYSLTFRLTKYTHYKPDGRRQMGGAKGRWQERAEYGGWSNATAPTGPWIYAGHTVPDALRLALAAPELAAAAADVLSHRVEGATRGDLRDNDASRKALGRLAAALALALQPAPASDVTGGEGLSAADRGEQP